MSIFDLEMRVGSSWFIPFEALFLSFLFATNLTDFSLLSLAFISVGVIVVYYTIAKITILKYIYLTVMWFLTWFITTGIFIIIYKKILSIPQNAPISSTEIAFVIFSFVIAFLFGLIRGASFRYYTEEIF